MNILRGKEALKEIKRYVRTPQHAKSDKVGDDNFLLTLQGESVIVWEPNPITHEIEGKVYNPIEGMEIERPIKTYSLSEYEAKSPDHEFKALLNKIKNEGEVTDGESVRPKYTDGESAHTKYITQHIYKYDISAGEFPIISLRNVAAMSSIKEILWIYQDQSNDLDLLRDKHGITWWDEWDIGDRTIGQRYGATVKKHDMVNKLIKSLKETPMNRRMIMSLYQEDDFNETDGLYPCAYSTTWNVRGRYLDVTLHQRSQDLAVICGINSIQYVALQMMIAKATGLLPGKFMHIVDNLHIYNRHWEQVEEMLARPATDNRPWIKFSPKSDNFYEFTIDDFKIMDNDHQGPLKSGRCELGI